jgi:hypothetical protein
VTYLGPILALRFAYSADVNLAAINPAGKASPPIRPDKAVADSVPNLENSTAMHPAATPAKAPIKRAFTKSDDGIYLS